MQYYLFTDRTLMRHPLTANCKQIISRDGAGSRKFPARPVVLGIRIFGVFNQGIQYLSARIWVLSILFSCIFGIMYIS